MTGWQFYLSVGMAFALHQLCTMIIVKGDAGCLLLGFKVARGFVMETWECGDVRQGGLLLEVRLLLDGDLQCLINRNDSRRGYVNLHVRVLRQADRRMRDWVAQSWRLKPRQQRRRQKGRGS